MKLILIVSLCFLAVVYCQTQNKNGNPTGEIGQPAFDEIVVESTLTVRGKPGSRSGKSLITNVKPLVQAEEAKIEKPKVTVESSSPVVARSRRSPQQFGYHGIPNFNSYPPRAPLSKLYSVSSSSAQASSNAMKVESPVGTFGSSSSQSSSQSKVAAHGKLKTTSGQSVSQVYTLPDNHKIQVSFSHSSGSDNGKPSHSNSHAVTITDPRGIVHKIVR